MTCCGLDPQSLSIVLEFAHNPMHCTEILGRAQDDERVEIVHFFLKLALMGSSAE